MKSLWALLAWGAACPCHGALLPQRVTNPRDATKQVAFLARRNGAHTAGLQPWLYNPPPAVLPRSKPLELPGDPLVLPPVDKMWGIQPSASPPTIEPPENKGDVGLQATVPPQSLEGWYATIPPQMIKDGLVDNRTAYYVRCLGGPNPCPYTVPPAVLRYWARVTPGKTFALADTAPGATVMQVLSNVGFTVGSTVKIDPGTPAMEVRTIAGLGSLIFSAPLTFPHAKGCPVILQVATTPPPMFFRPWSNFQPMFFPYSPMPGPAPGPAPMPFGPAPGPAYLPGPFLPVLSFGAPAPAPGGAPFGAPAGAPVGAPGGPAGAPGLAPAPAR